MKLIYLLHCLYLLCLSLIIVLLIILLLTMLSSYSKHIITAFLLIQFHAPHKRFCSTDLDFVQIFRNFSFN